MITENSEKSGEKELIHLLEKKNEKINKNLKKKIQKEKKKMVSENVVNDALY